jgi:N-acetylglucosamine-6-phosphate deacetylase
VRIGCGFGSVIGAHVSIADAMSPSSRQQHVLALAADRVFTGEAMLSEHAVLIEAGRIEAVVPAAAVPPGTARRQLDGLLAPGFIDAQVNGGGGVLFNEATDEAGIRTIGAAHRRFGTTGFLPTLISDTRAKLQAAIDAVRQARAHGVPGVLGLHAEGPFLAPARRGVHAERMLRQPDSGDLDRLAGADCGVLLVTVAPERMPEGSIERLVAAGSRVAAGHTAASYAETCRGLGRGISGFTHLFNAMSALTSREPGAVGAALADAGSWCGIILDGHHVHPASLKVALKAKPRGKLFLVTDAMPPVGTDQRSFMLDGEPVRLESGRLVTADGTLAGSALDMASAVRNAVELLQLPLEEALRMASAYPADFLGIAGLRGRLRPGLAADLVLLDDRLRARETWIDGEPALSGEAAAD